jgi:hypothetical protein
MGALSGRGAQILHKGFKNLPRAQKLCDNRELRCSQVRFSKEAKQVRQEVGEMILVIQEIFQKIDAELKIVS